MRWLMKDSDYLAYPRCVAHNDYGGAIRHLRKVLARARLLTRSPEEAGYLLITIGRFQLFQGKELSAARTFVQADRQSGGSCLIRLLIGEFYLEWTDKDAVGVRWLRRSLESDSEPPGRHDERWRRRAQSSADQRT